MSWRVTNAAGAIKETDVSSRQVLSNALVLETGIAGQLRAGRALTVADFTNLGLSAPVALWNLADLTDASGNGRTLTNKGTVTFGSGITGAATEAAIFTGNTAQALYIADTGTSDPFRITYGSVGCWFRVVKLGTAQILMAKHRNAAGSSGWYLGLLTNGTVNAGVTLDGVGNTASGLGGVTPLIDDRWHFVVMTYDGATTSIYVDGMLDNAIAWSSGGPMFGSPAPLNIGGYGADGSTASTQPTFGRVDEGFITQDVLSLDQIRLLYAAKFAHGYGTTPQNYSLNVQRMRKGGTLPVSAFSTQPLHLYNFTGGVLTDQGSLNNTLTNNGAATVAPGADGSQSNAFNFNGSSQYLSASDTGLPTTGAKSYGAWFATTSTSARFLMGYGIGGTSEDLYIAANGTINYEQNGTARCGTGVSYNDGTMHFAVIVVDPAAADGLLTKLYIDGKLAGGNTTSTNPVLGGAAGLRIGTNGSTFWLGRIDGAFFTNYAMSADEIAKLYAVGSEQMAASPKNEGDHIEGIDSTYAYIVADTLDSQSLLNLTVGSQTTLQPTTAAQAAATQVTQTAHGFAVGNAVYYTGTAWAKAQADTGAHAEVVGIVSAVLDSNNFVLTTSGYVSTLTGLTAGAVYFLDPTTAGALTTTEPTGSQQISKPLLIATSTTSGYVMHFRGMQVSASSNPNITTSPITTGPPASPSDGDIWIATQVDANGTRWQFQYDSSESTSAKWKFIGGPDIGWRDYTFSQRQNVSAATWEQIAGSSTITLTRAGYYRVAYGCVAESTSSTQAYFAVQYGAAIPSNAYTFNQFTGTGASFVPGSDMSESGAVAANTVVKFVINSSPVTNVAYYNAWFRITPIKVS